MIFDDFTRAVAQLSDGRFQKVMAKGIGLTLLLLFAMFFGLHLFLGWLIPESFTLPFIGEITWIDSILSGGAIILMIVLSVFLMVPVASAFTGLFLDEVSDAVEDRHYAALPPVTPASFGDMLGDSLKFLGVMIAANLLAFLLYVIFAPFAPLIFWSLNGFLLGREYFQMVALRRLAPQEAKALRRQNMWQIWLAGGILAMGLSVPIVNLFLPVLAAASFTHLYHRVTAL
ncbi:MAG: EI24 domain-containing protein [Halocynthiibacter sp.]